MSRVQGLLKARPFELTSRWTAICFVPQGRFVLGVARGWDARNVNLPCGVSGPADETPQDAAFRILRETTRVRAKEALLLDSWPSGTDWRTVHAYLVTSFEGPPFSTSHGRAYWALPPAFLRATSEDRAWAEKVLRRLRRVPG